MRFFAEDSVGARCSRGCALFPWVRCATHGYVM